MPQCYPNQRQNAQFYTMQYVKFGDRTGAMSDRVTQPLNFRSVL